MKARELVVTAVVACAIGWFAKSAWSDDPAPDSKEAWMKFAQPGEQHAKLKALVGEWAVHGKFTENGKVTETDSTASMTMVMGGRYLRQEVKGMFQGMPFEGRGIIGYDNGSKRWVSSWIDNMGTGILVGDGEETQPGKVWTFKSSYNSPAGPMPMRDVMTVVNDKEMVWESFLGGGDKPMMSLQYVRKGDPCAK